MKKLLLIVALVVTNVTFILSKDIEANILKVTTTKSENSYTFNVRVKSDETGCKQYCNWWEILDEKGRLLYRRILFHSHPTEQPFTRSGGSLKLDKNQKVYIRAHMNNLGYVGNVFEGTVSSGFKESINPPKFSAMIEKQKPLPDGCAF